MGPFEVVSVEVVLSSYHEGTRDQAKAPAKSSKCTGVDRGKLPAGSLVALRKAHIEEMSEFVAIMRGRSCNPCEVEHRVAVPFVEGKGEGALEHLVPEPAIQLDYVHAFL